MRIFQSYGVLVLLCVTSCTVANPSVHAVADGAAADLAPMDHRGGEQSPDDLLGSDQVAPDAPTLTGDALTGDTSAGDAGSPDAGSPDAGSPDVLSPDVLSPDVLSPDVLSPDVLSPDVLSPDVLSLDVLSPDLAPPRSWEQLKVPTTVDLHDVHFPMDGLTGYVAGAGGTLLKTKDGGVSWQTLTPGTTFANIHFLNRKKGFAISKSSSTTYRTDDGGLTWQTLSTCCGSAYSGLHFFNASVGYAGGKGMHKTTNGGTSWSTGYPILANGVNYRDVFAVSRTRAYFVATLVLSGKSYSYLYRTDGGPWTRLYLSTTHSLSAIDFPKATTGYVCGRGIMLKTLNGGAFFKQTTPAKHYLNDVSFVPTTDTGVAVGGLGEIIYTGDGGTHWVAEKSRVKTDLLAASAPVVDAIYAVGKGGVVLKRH